MATVLVTGAAGFIGSHTVEILLEQGHRVVGVDNFRTGRPENLAVARRSGAFSFQEGDVAEAGVLERQAQAVQPQAIVHLAALVGVQESMQDPSLNFRLNVALVHEVAEAARRQRVGRVVFASSAAVYGGDAHEPLAESREPWPLSPYGGAKLAGEALLLGQAQAFGFSAVCLRYFNVLGPRQRADSPYSGVISKFAECARQRKTPTVFGDGRQTRDFVHVRDVARANALAATWPSTESARLNVCSGRETSLLEILAWLRSLAPGSLDPVFQPSRQGDIIRSVGDPRRARELLGFAAATEVKASLEELIRAATVPATG